VNDVATPIVELRLLTHRPEEMERWWAAMLDGTPRRLSSRTTAITGRRLRLVIERSQIAYDYHPEASGVTAINLTFDNVSAGHRTLTRLARLGSQPHRATREAGVTALWLRDPNGIDVTMRLPPPVVRASAEADTLLEELDVGTALADIDGRRSVSDHGLHSQTGPAQRICCAYICTDGCVVE
jgi:catechol-2,3-dioxygenase